MSAIFLFESQRHWEDQNTTIPVPRRWYHKIRRYWIKEYGSLMQIVTKHGTFKVLAHSNNCYRVVRVRR